MATLRITTGPGQGQSIECNREVVIGREGADLVIDDEEASRRHAAVRPGPGGIEVEDLGSLNGTFVDGERIGGVTTLTSNATLRVGRTEFALEVSAADLPLADPQRTLASATPVIDVGERTVVRDRPVIDVPDRTVVRETPTAVPEPAPETPPAAPEPAPETPQPSPEPVATPVATTIRQTIPSEPPPAGPPPSVPAPPPSVAASPSGAAGGRAASGPPVRLIVPLVVIVIVAVVVLLLTHVI